MKAVANATPLIALALLERLDLLRAIFSEIVVPEAVYNEIVAHGLHRPGAISIAQARWLQVLSPTATTTIEPLLLGLDVGEMQVLFLARELRPDWVLIDERQARRTARAMGLPVKGTLGILLAAVELGLISKQECLEASGILTRNGIRIGAQWQAWLQEQVNKL